MGRPLGIDGPHLSIFEAPRALEGPARQEKEASLLLDGLMPAGTIILLDERGKDWTSRQLSDSIAKERDEGAPGVTFLIGGADGFAHNVTDCLGRRPIRKIAFGRATWPHMLVRSMLCEQIYRAMTLMAGHPYHRD